MSETFWTLVLAVGAIDLFCFAWIVLFVRDAVPRPWWVLGRRQLMATTAGSFVAAVALLAVMDLVR